VGPALLQTDGGFWLAAFGGRRRFARVHRVHGGSCRTPALASGMAWATSDGIT
jgi:hypothetical protein